MSPSVLKSFDNLLSLIAFLFVLRQMSTICMNAFHCLLILFWVFDVRFILFFNFFQFDCTIWWWEQMRNWKYYVWLFVELMIIDITRSVKLNKSFSNCSRACGLHVFVYWYWHVFISWLICHECSNKCISNLFYNSINIVGAQRVCLSIQPLYECVCVRSFFFLLCECIQRLRSKDQHSDLCSRTFSKFIKWKYSVSV